MDFVVWEIGPFGTLGRGCILILDEDYLACVLWLAVEGMAIVKGISDYERNNDIKKEMIWKKEHQKENENEDKQKKE